MRVHVVLLVCKIIVLLVAGETDIEIFDGFSQNQDEFIPYYVSGTRAPPFSSVLLIIDKSTKKVSHQGLLRISHDHAFFMTSGRDIDQKKNEYRVYNTRWSVFRHVHDWQTMPLLRPLWVDYGIAYFACLSEDNSPDSVFINQLQTEHHYVPVLITSKLPDIGKHACLMENIRDNAGHFEFDKIVVLAITMLDYIEEEQPIQHKSSNLWNKFDKRPKPDSFRGLAKVQNYDLNDATCRGLGVYQIKDNGPNIRSTVHLIEMVEGFDEQKKILYFRLMTRTFSKSMDTFMTNAFKDALDEIPQMHFI